MSEKQRHHDIWVLLIIIVIMAAVAGTSLVLGLEAGLLWTAPEGESYERR
jgi:hypothetical protein